MNNNEKILKRAHKAKVFAIINLLLLVASFVFVIVNGSFDIECFWFNKGYDASKYAFYLAASIFAISAIIGFIVCIGSKNSPEWEGLKSNDPYTLEDQGNSIRSLAKANGVKLPVVFPSMLILIVPIAAFLLINFNVMGFAWLHNGGDDVDVDAILARQEKLEKEDKEDKVEKEDKDDSDSKDEDDSKVDENIDIKDVDKRVDAMIKIGEKRGYTCSSNSLEDSYFVNFNPENILEDESLTVMIEKDGTITMVSYSCYFVSDLSVDGSFTTGGAVAVMLIINGFNAWLALVVAFIAGLLAGTCTGILHTKLGIPAILSGILTQFSLYSINLAIMGYKSNK